MYDCVCVFHCLPELLFNVALQWLKHTYCTVQYLCVCVFSLSLVCCGKLHYVYRMTLCVCVCVLRCVHRRPLTCWLTVLLPHVTVHRANCSPTTVHCYYISFNIAFFPSLYYCMSGCQQINTTCCVLFSLAKNKQKNTHSWCKVSQWAAVDRENNSFQ